MNLQYDSQYLSVHIFLVGNFRLEGGASVDLPLGERVVAVMIEGRTHVPMSSYSYNLAVVPLPQQ